MITVHRHFVYDISDKRAEGTVQVPRLNLPLKSHAFLSSYTGQPPSFIYQ